MRLLPARSWRADSFRTKPSDAIAASTFARVTGLTTSGRFSTFDTVPRETPAAAATAFTPAACCFAFRRLVEPERAWPAPDDTEAEREELAAVEAVRADVERDDPAGLAAGAPAEDEPGDDAESAASGAFAAMLDLPASRPWGGVV
jgi:hypothetical protein